MDGHVVNSRRANLEFVSERRTLFQHALETEKEALKLTKRFHIFTLQCF